MAFINGKEILFSVKIGNTVEEYDGTVKIEARQKYYITYNLTNCTAPQKPTEVAVGTSYIDIVVDAASGYTLDGAQVSITGAPWEILEDYQTQVVYRIYDIMGDITISVSAVKQTDEPDATEYYYITYNLTNCTAPQKPPKVAVGTSYIDIMVYAASGYTLDGAQVSITGAPWEILEDYQTQVVYRIYDIMGDITISVSAVKQATYLFQYEWITADGVDNLPPLVSGVSYTLFVNGDEIDTLTYNGERSVWFGKSGGVYFNYENTGSASIYCFHPVDSTVKSGNVSMRINSTTEPEDPTSYVLRGIGRFNDTLTQPASYGGCIIYVPTDSSIPIAQIHRIELDQDFNGELVVLYWYTDDNRVTAYSNGQWANESYRDFNLEPTTVSEVMYNWFNANVEFV